MPSLTSSLRLLSAAARVALLWLLAAGCADAAPADPPVVASAARVGEGATTAAPATTSERRRAERRKARRRPKLSTHDFVPRIGHAIAVRPVAAAVVQDDDAPAAQDAGADRGAPGFCPIGIVSGGRLHPRSRRFSPQPPRGPPATA
jgi:hypothetical protein